MSKLVWQIKIIDGVKALFPFCEESDKAIDKFKMNQPVTSGNLSGTRKERSLIQNNLYFASCKYFYEQIMPSNTFANVNVDYWWRYNLKYLDYSKTLVMPDGSVHFQPLPLNFSGADQALANGYYDKAFRGMSEMLRVNNVDRFIDEVKSRIGTR